MLSAGSLATNGSVANFPSTIGLNGKGKGSKVLNMKLAWTMSRAGTYETYNNTNFIDYTRTKKSLTLLKQSLIVVEVPVELQPTWPARDLKNKANY